MSSNKIKNALSLYHEGIRDGDVEAIHRYTGERYTQHNTHVKDGKEGFIEFFEDFKRRNPKRDIRIIRSFEDGNHVFLHAYQNLNDGAAQWVTFDFFDTDENDKLIEHWDVITAFSDSTPGGHTSIDGPTEIKDLDRTDDNKALVKTMIEQVLMPGGNPDRVDEFISSERYIQHSKEMPDGLEAFRQLVTKTQRPLNYHEIVLCVGQGNFVATLCKADWMGEDCAQADLFRIDQGMIVEHWGAAEKIPPRDTWLNSGKF